MESEIAQFLVGSGPRGTIVDVALGGGTCFFMPNSTTGSCRTDDEDLLAKARDSGFTILRGLKALNEWHDESGHEQAGPVLGFFHDDVRSGFSPVCTEVDVDAVSDLAHGFRNRSTTNNCFVR